MSNLEKKDGKEILQGASGNGNTRSSKHEKFVRTKRSNIASIKVNLDENPEERLIDIQKAAQRRGEELGLHVADYSRYLDLDVSRELE